MVNKMKKFLFGLCFSLFLTFSAQAQTLTAEVNRSEIPEGETFMLTLSYDGNENDTPDIGVLNDDFTIFSVGNTVRNQMINGKFSRERQWNLVLMPKSAGEITIPAIKLGNSESRPLTIRVIKAGEAYSGDNMQNGMPQPNQKPRFFIQGSIDTPNPFVQEQMNYTVTLYDAGGLQGSEPTFVNADAKDWIIRSLGNPEIKSVTINGINMREIKFNYALFPQRSGKLTVPQARFDGYYLTKPEQRIDPFRDLFHDDFMGFGLNMNDMFATRNPVTLVTKPIEADIRPVPQENGGNWWIPAQNVVLYSRFEPENPQFKVGEAVKRNIYLKAEGVLDNQLPEINFKNIAGVKQYPEKPIVKSVVENGKVISIAQIANVYIPNRGGEAVIPAISVDWFNVKTNKLEKATLPEIKINIADGGADTAAESYSEPQRDEIVPEKTAVKKSAVVSQPVSVNPYLLTGAAFAAGILLTALFFVLRKKSVPSVSAAPVKDWRKYVLQQAKAGNLRALRDGIIEWCRNKYGDGNIANLSDVAKIVGDKTFANELEKLSSALYSGAENEWTAEKFIKTFDNLGKQKTGKNTERDILPKLYD